MQIQCGGGNNEITIRFNEVSSLIPSIPYNVILTVIVESNIKETTI